MADRGMAVYAAFGFAAGETMSQNVIDDVAMTVHAIVVQDSRADCPQANWFWKILKRETFGVPKAILRLDEILQHEFMRNMAIIAGRDGMMAGLLPAVVLVAHDVTIDTRLRIAAEIGKAFGILHRVGTSAEHNSEERAQDQPRGADPSP